MDALFLTGRGLRRAWLHLADEDPRTPRTPRTVEDEIAYYERYRMAPPEPPRATYCGLPTRLLDRIEPGEVRLMYERETVENERGEVVALTASFTLIEPPHTWWCRDCAYASRSTHHRRGDGGSWPAFGLAQTTGHRGG